MTIIKIDFQHTHKINFIQPDNWVNNCEAVLQVKEEGEAYDDLYKDDDLSDYDEENDNEDEEMLEDEVSKVLYRKNEIINNFFMQMQRVTAIIQLTDDSDILELMENFTNKVATVTTPQDLNGIFSVECETSSGGGKEQSVSGSARKSFHQRNSVSQKLSLCENSESTEKKNSDAENTSENSNNTPNVIYLF